MKGQALRWSKADRQALAQFSGSEIVRLVDWYRANVGSVPAELVFAAGTLPARPAPSANRRRVVPAERAAAIAAFADAALVPPFTWSAAIRFYFDSTGRAVSWKLVKETRDVVRVAGENEARRQSERLVAGEITIGQWQAAMADIVKMGHGSAAMLTMGGWAGLEAETWEDVAAGIDFQLEYLDGFAQALQEESYPIDGRFWQRIVQYPRSLTKAWWHLTGQEMFKRGYDLEMNVLGGTENCEDCLEQSYMGWVRQGELIDIGDRQCLNFCSCEIQYASSFSGATWKDELID